MKASDREQEDRLCGELATDLDGSFPRLVVAFQGRLYAFALRLTGSPRDAEEIAQDAFIRAYRALRGYPEERVRGMVLKSWLYQITLNVARNQLRRRHPATVSLDQEGDNAPASLPDDDSRGPEALFQRAEERNQLAGLVATLPEHYRAAVVLRHVSGLSYAEVADILKQPAGTVKANVHRGIQLLRARLAEQGLVDHNEWRHDDGKAESIIAVHGAATSRRTPRSR